MEVFVKEGGISGSKSWSVSSKKIEFVAMELGATLAKIFVFDKNGNKTDVLLGYDTADGFLAGVGSHGAIVGRVANRIANASFELNGKSYKLDSNDGKNCLHGGFFRWEKQIWNSRALKNGVEFFRKSVAGEQGFPGNLDVFVRYTIFEENTLKIEYEAKSDADTPFAPTNHAYFNLNGSGSALHHVVKIFCKKVAEAGAHLIPTGKLILVQGTPWDFLNGKEVKKDISRLEGEPSFGYDHSFETNANGKIVPVAEVLGEKIKMKIRTDAPALHFYSGNFLEGVKGKGGAIHKNRDGLCFETGFFPNSLNTPAFPSVILKAGDTFRSVTEFSFDFV